MTFKLRLTLKGSLNGNGCFNWAEAILDAGIMSGISFMATMGGLGASGLLANPQQGILACTIAALGEFFAILAAKRGLVKPQGA